MSVMRRQAVKKNVTVPVAPPFDAEETAAAEAEAEAEAEATVSKDEGDEPDTEEKEDEGALEEEEEGTAEASIENVDESMEDAQEPNPAANEKDSADVAESNRAAGEEPSFVEKEVTEYEWVKKKQSRELVVGRNKMKIEMSSSDLSEARIRLARFKRLDDERAQRDHDRNELESFV